MIPRGKRLGVTWMSSSPEFDYFLQYDIPHIKDFARQCLGVYRLPSRFSLLAVLFAMRRSHTPLPAWSSVDSAFVQHGSMGFRLWLILPIPMIPRIG